MSRKASERSALVEAAQALTEELERLRSLVGASTREKLESARSLERAAAALQEIPEAERRIHERLLALAQAFEGARMLQEQLGAETQKRAAEISARAAKLQALLAAQAALAEETRQLNASAQTMDGERTGDALGRVEAGVARIVEQTRELGANARQSGFHDLARASEALRQQVLALKNKIELARPLSPRSETDERA